ncbi:MAG TPA: DUF1501 domain-containing protein [Planctomycetaceae bacterium]|jgi:hypothetical protein
MPSIGCHQPAHRQHAFGDFHGRTREGLTLLDRRGMLKAGVAGIAGLSLPELLRVRAQAAESGQPMKSRKSVILLWMAGGPSHIDTLDPKPYRPFENRGPFGVTSTKLPGVVICEHLPKLVAMLDKFTIIRSVDPRHSNHEPNSVMQSANNEAEPRTNPEADRYPAIASLVAKFRGPNHPAMPPYVAFMKSRSHLAFGGYLGTRWRYNQRTPPDPARPGRDDLSPHGRASGFCLLRPPRTPSPHRRKQRPTDSRAVLIQMTAPRR